MASVEEDTTLENVEREEEEENVRVEGEDDETAPLLPAPIQQTSKRVYAFDLFRGLIMVFESIDHSREFLSKIKVEHEEWYNMPDFYNRDNNEGMPFLAWLLRSITGLCAPGFFFLMGMGIVYFVENRRKLGWSNSRHFATRCGVLVFANFFHFPFLYIFMKVGVILTVLYALGINIFVGSVILLAELAVTKRLSNAFSFYFEENAKYVALAVSCCIFYITAGLSLTTFVTVYHDTLPLPRNISSYNPGDFLLMSFIPCTRCDSVVFSIYPFIPWITPVVWGLLFGRIYTQLTLSNTTKIRINVATGLSLLLLFLTLRSTNLGSIHNELLSPPLHDDFISFMNLTKYPPSLTYLFWTIGINHLLIAGFLAAPPPSKYNPLLVFGKSALFFYVAHFYVYTILLLLASPFAETGANGRPVLSFPVYVVFWIIGLVPLYFMSFYYEIFKSKKGPDSLWRLF